MNRYSLAAITLALVLAACAGSAGAPTPSASESPDASRPARSTPPLETVPPATDEPVIGEVPAALLDQVKAETAERAGVGIGDLEVVVAEAVTWNDGSLGCPEPGMVYTQALVPGYRVVIKADGIEYSFHGAENGTLIFCENPAPGGRSSAS